MKVAVVLFNLGGPDSIDAVGPFLTNLFSDPAILPLPGILRRPLAALIAKRRAPVAREIYAKIGGRSPIVEQTEAQARALEAELETRGCQARVLVAMRAWQPFAAQAAENAAKMKPDRIVLLPLYPQYSTTTTNSSLADWWRVSGSMHLSAVETRVCCYPWQEGLIASVAANIAGSMGLQRAGVDYRLLVSAHGLPKAVIARGDPYRWQVENTAKAVVDRLGIENLDWVLCFQSRVGPLQWIGPATDAEIRRAGAERKGVIIAPIAFVSEHSETLVELDIEYARLARESGVPHYLRVPAVGTHPLFIAGLASMVLRALQEPEPVTCDRGRICPAAFRQCGYGLRHV